jgi:MFS family permease
MKPLAKPNYRDWWVVSILFLASVLGYIDRVILTFLVEPIRKDLLLSDSEIGLLTGFAFAVLYVIGGVFIGRSLDRGNRPLILAICIVVWSIATALSGLATGFFAMFLARMLVGVGEAALNPAAMGIISQRFPSDQIQKPIGLFTTGLYVGGGLAMILGGSLLVKLPADGFFSIPLFGPAETWRLIFLVLAIPGIIIAALVLIGIKEPRSAPRKKIKIDNQPALAFMKTNKRMFALAACAIVAWSMNNYGLLNWYPAMMMRTFGMSPSEVAAGYGSAFLFGGIAGCLATQPVLTYLRKRFHDRAVFILCTIGMVVLGITSFISPLMGNADAVITMAFITLFVSAMSVASVFILIVSVIPKAYHGIYTGLYMALVNLTGGAFGSVIVGVLNDFIFGELGIHMSLATMALIFGPLSAVLMFFASRQPIKYETN